MQKVVLFLVLVIFTGCSSIVHQYNKDRVFVGSYSQKNLPSSFNVGSFKYIPSEGLEQNEFLLIGLLSDENRKVNTNISTIVENEVKKFTNQYIINKKNTKCMVSGEVYEISWNSVNGDTKSIINYILKLEDNIIDKTEITHIWTQGLFTIRTIPQKLSFSIHGNVDMLTKNSNFLESLNRYCK